MDMALNQLAAAVAAPAPVPAPIPRARASDHPRSIDGLVTRALSQSWKPRASRRPAQARVQPRASARARARARPSTHCGVGPHAFGCTRRARARAHAPLSGMGRRRRPLPLSAASCILPRPALLVQQTLHPLPRLCTGTRTRLKHQLES